MPIPIPNPGDYTVPPSDGFTPDRLGVRRFAVDLDRVTNAIGASFTPCPATALEWGSVDAPEVVSPDLVATILAAPDSAEKSAAVQSLQNVQTVMGTDLLVIAEFLLSLRE